MDDLIIRSLMGATTQREERELAAWRAASPANDAKFRRLSSVWAITEADGEIASSGPVPEAQTIVEAAESVPRPRGGRRFEPAKWAGVAAAIAVVVLGVLLAGDWSSRTAPSFGAKEFVTGHGETATVSLRDGSVVRLGPESRLRVDDDRRREVGLVGHAYFAVAKRPGDPFEITTPGGTMTVLGTRFDLKADDDDLRLLVVEGRVALSSHGRRTEVSAGEMAQIVNGTPLPNVRIPVADTLLDWVGEFLAFQSTPLRRAVHEIERHYGVRVRVLDGRLPDETVTGWFSEWELEDLLTVVCTIVGAEWSRTDDLVTIRAR